MATLSDSVPSSPSTSGRTCAVGNRLIQLTWQRGRAFVYDLETFDPLGVHRYVTEGWGSATTAITFYMTDGSSTSFVATPTALKKRNRSR